MYKIVVKILKTTDSKTVAVFVSYILISVTYLLAMPLLFIVWTQSSNPVYVTGALLLWFALSQGQAVLENILSFLGNAYRMEQIKRSFNTCVTINYEFFESAQGQDLFHKAVLNTNSSSAPFAVIHLLIARCVFSLTFLLLSLVSACFIDSFIDNKLFTITFILCAAGMAGIHFIGNKVEKHAWRTVREGLLRHSRKSAYLNKITQLQEKAEILHYYNASQFIKKKYEHIFTALMTLFTHFHRQCTVYTIVRNTALFMIQFLLTIAVGTSGNTHIAWKTYIMLLPILWQCNKVVSIFTTNYFDLKKTLSSIEYYYVFLKHGEPTSSLTVLNEKVTAITFNRVAFQYTPVSRFKIRNFDLSITEGQKIGIVGLNGSGKTTIVKLLLRFYALTAGTITVNNTDLTTIDNIQDKIACVFQDDIIIPGTIRDNILMGRPCSQAKYHKALEDSGLQYLLETKSWKDTLLIPSYYSNNSVDFSAGEKQLLFLARCIYKDADIMIFDEPSAALDPIAEMNLFEKYCTLLKDKIGLFITHRCSSVKMFDSIIVLKNGAIIEQGTFEKLMELNGEYAGMYKEQMQVYV